jgi:hypothetical protein
LTASLPSMMQKLAGRLIMSSLPALHSSRGMAAVRTSHVPMEDTLYQQGNARVQVGVTGVRASSTHAARAAHVCSKGIIGQAACWHRRALSPDVQVVMTTAARGRHVGADPRASSSCGGCAAS